jgi:hypothetical protein
MENKTLLILRADGTAWINRKPAPEGPAGKYVAEAGKIDRFTRSGKHAWTIDKPGIYEADPEGASRLNILESEILLVNQTSGGYCWVAFQKEVLPEIPEPPQEGKWRTDHGAVRFSHDGTSDWGICRDRRGRWLQTRAVLPYSAKADLIAFAEELDLDILTESTYETETLRNFRQLEGESDA